MFRIKSTHRLLAVLLAVLMMVTTIPVGLLGIGKAEAVESDMTMYHQETSSIAVELIARYDSGSGEGGAEIVAYDQKSNRAYITNGTEKAIDIVDLSTLNDPSGEITLFQRIKAADLPLLGSFTANDITSVAVHPDGTYVAATVSADPETDKGRVVLLDQDGEFIKYFETGYLPDMLAFTPNGNKILVANEGEPNDAYTIDPVGSVSIIDLANGHENATVTDVGFGGLDGKIDADVRIFGGTDPTPEKDLEPEYIVVSADGATAYVVLQENNAVAELDIATKTFTRVHAFGFKDHSIRGNELDASNKDEAINIRNWPVLGMYQPDSIDIFTANGKNYLVTANEGDARDYDGFSEEKRVAKIKDDISLNAANYQGYTQDQIDQLVADGLFNEENLGRLKITTTLGKTGDNYEALYSYGTRSFSIWEMGNGSMEQVFDSGSDFEEIIADNIRWYFNHDDNEKDARSDDKGPEPEDVVIGTVGGKQYAFIGLECMGGVMVYDVSDPQNAKFETYFTSHNFDTIADGDWSPEGLNFVPAYQSLTGVALLLVAHEKSGTVAVYELQAQQAQEQQKITIIHTNDFHGRAASFDRPGVEGTIGGLDRITTIVKEERAKGQPLLVLDAGDTIHGTNLANLNQGKPVIEVMNEIGYAAMAVGNHEFNFGMAVLEQRAEQAEFPFLAANVRYKNGDPVPFFEPYTIIVAGDTTVGVIGLATTDTPTTTHPDNVAELEFLDPVAVTKDIVAQIKDQVDLIVLLAHMDFEDEQKVLDAVPGIAIAISGHTHQLRADIRDDGTILLAGGEHGRILGQLDVISTQDSTVTAHRQGFIPITAAISKRSDVENILAYYRTQLEQTLAEEIGEAAVVLDGERANVRSKETNLGNLVADVLRQKAGADIALQNGGGIRASIDEGPVTRGEVYEVLPFDNYIVALQLTGQQIWQALENGVAKYPALRGQFLQVSGIKFTFDPQRPVGNRIVNVTVGGVALNLTQTYNVATNCFMAAGGDGYTMLKEAKEANGMVDTGAFMRDAVVAYINANSPVAPQVEGRIVIGFDKPDRRDDDDDDHRAGGGGATPPAADTAKDASKAVTDQLKKAQEGDTVAITAKKGETTLAVGGTVLNQLAEKKAKLAVESKEAQAVLKFDPQALLTDELKKAGKDAVVEISAKILQDQATQAAADFAINIGGKKLRAYQFGVTVKEKAGAKTGTKVHNLNGEVTITLDLAGINLTGIDTGQLTMQHKQPDGTWLELKSAFDPKTKTLTFTTDSFSVFMVMEKPDAQNTIKLTIGQATMMVDGKQQTMDVQPYIQAGTNRTMVPVRFVSEMLGAAVEWNGPNRQVEIADGAKQIVLTIGSKTVLVDGSKTTIDSAAEVLPPGRTFVPLRFISETLGAQVNYNETTRQITIVR